MLEDGFVMTLEPGMTWGGRMMVHEENITITSDGARLLTRRAPENVASWPPERLSSDLPDAGGERV